MQNGAERLIKFIKESKKKTPLKVYVNNINDKKISEDIKVFGEGNSKILFGEQELIFEFLDKNKDVEVIEIEIDRRNSAVPMLNLSNINARIEKGAIIRDQVKIGDNSVIMMGAVINIGAEIGRETMIDMNAVIGGRAIIGKRCHVGAGAVLAGVIEPPSATPVIIEDDVLIGANAVVLEGVKVGRGSIIAAGAVVLEDVLEESVVAGIPARVIKKVDSKAKDKSIMINALREL